MVQTRTASAGVCRSGLMVQTTRASAEVYHSESMVQSQISDVCPLFLILWEKFFSLRLKMISQIVEIFLYLLESYLVELDIISFGPILYVV